MKRSRSLWDLVDDEHTGRLQASKCWLHVGNMAGTYKFLQVPMQNLTMEMLTAYLTIVALGYGGMYWLTGRRRTQDVEGFNGNGENMGGASNQDDRMGLSDSVLSADDMGDAQGRQPARNRADGSGGKKGRTSTSGKSSGKR